MEKTKLEIILKDADAQKVVEVIMQHGRTGSVGDGKIFFCSVDEVYEIASGETGDKSISDQELEPSHFVVHR